MSGWAALALLATGRPSVNAVSVIAAVQSAAIAANLAASKSVRGAWLSLSSV